MPLLFSESQKTALFFLFVASHFLTQHLNMHSSLSALFLAESIQVLIILEKLICVGGYLFQEVQTTINRQRLKLPGYTPSS